MSCLGQAKTGIWVQMGTAGALFVLNKGNTQKARVLRKLTGQDCPPLRPGSCVGEATCPTEAGTSCALSDGDNSPGSTEDCMEKCNEQKEVRTLLKEPS